MKAGGSTTTTYARHGHLHVCKRGKFLTGNANAFSITLGDLSSAIIQNALGFYVQDNYKVRPNVTLELGFRYDWNMTPTERYNRFVVSIRRPGRWFRPEPESTTSITKTTRNFQPRVGFAWDPFKDGKTSVRARLRDSRGPADTNLVTGSRRILRWRGR